MTKTIAGLPFTAKDEARFWAKVEKEEDLEGCWTWVGGMSGCGYGGFKLSRKVIAPHLVAYEIANGPISKGPVRQEVRHGPCENKRCVNPEHLILGTSADNKADKNGGIYRLPLGVLPVSEWMREAMRGFRKIAREAIFKPRGRPRWTPPVGASYRPKSNPGTAG